MEHITIRNLGSVSDCDVDIEDFLIFTGPQASGKSTVSKAIFFFNDLENVLRQIFYNRFIKERSENSKDITEIFKSEIKNRFIQIYGDAVINDNSEFYLSYSYDTDMSISLEYGKRYDSSDAINVVISDGIADQISELDDHCRKINDPLILSTTIRTIFSGILGKTKNVVYVPAGRSILTSFGSQIDYVYLSMGKDQQDKIDYCMRHFIELAIKIRPSFENGTDLLALVAILKTLWNVIKNVGRGVFYACEPLVGILHGGRDNEGIKKIVDMYNDDLKGTLDSVDGMLDAGKGYKTFTKLPSGMDGNVKFIYKTEEINNDK